MGLLFASQGEGGRPAARRLLAHALGCGPEDLPELERAPGGKPWFPQWPDLHFSLSHAGPYALCALDESPVGADIEPVRPRGPFLPRRALSEEEYGWYLDRGGRWEDFYTLWTLKESRCKWTGQGITRPPRTVAVPLLEPGEARQVDGLWFWAFGGAGWRAGVCGGERFGDPVWL